MGFHSAWANVLTQRLNRDLLPEGYYALPNVQLGGQVEIDVATFARGGAGNGPTTATAGWAPRPPAAPADFAGAATPFARRASRPRHQSTTVRRGRPSIWELYFPSAARDAQMISLSFRANTHRSAKAGCDQTTFRPQLGVSGSTRWVRPISL